MWRIHNSNISLDKRRPQQTTTSRAAVFHGLSHMKKSHLRNCSFSSVTEYAVHKIQIRVLLFSMVSSDCPTKHCCTTRMYMSWHDRASVKISGRKRPFDLEKVWISRQRVYFNTSERLFDLKKKIKIKKKKMIMSRESAF